MFNLEVDFDFDPDDFERQVKEEVERESTRKVEATLERLGRTHEGRPKDEIRAALRRELEQEPGDELVDAIHDGTPVEVRFEWR